MKVSVTYLRRHLKRVLRALERNEDVHLLWRGQPKGVIKAVGGKPRIKVQGHPFFNRSESSETVDHQVTRLRRRRLSRWDSEIP